MTITFKQAEIHKAGLAIFPVFDDLVRNGVGSSLALNFEDLAQAADFKGQKGQFFSVYALDGAKSNQVIFAGAGKKADFDAEMFAANLTKKFLMSRQTDWVLYLDGYDISPDSAARAALGAKLAT
ncbi:MAG: M17 family peptidase N-terminal domain-containing protein, partial [Maricaulaceae bacterium]